MDGPILYLTNATALSAKKIEERRRLILELKRQLKAVEIAIANLDIEITDAAPSR